MKKIILLILLITISKSTTILSFPPELQKQIQEVVAHQAQEYLQTVNSINTLIILEPDDHRDYLTRRKNNAAILLSKEHPHEKHELNLLNPEFVFSSVEQEFNSNPCARVIYFFPKMTEDILHKIKDIKHPSISSDNRQLKLEISRDFASAILELLPKN